MFNRGSFPGLVLFPDGETIRGELYNVTSEIIARLDDLEGNEYERKQIHLFDVPTGACGYIYCGDVTGLSLCGPEWTESM
jgi:gamma-glutamylcyclotransferase (GGCT)/AIG2-like uncharacterized protein YtfP